MYCPKCGNEVLLTDDGHYGIKIGLCESCNHEFTVKDHGKVAAEKLDKARKCLQRKFEKAVYGLEPTKKTLAKIK